MAASSSRWLEFCKDKQKWLIKKITKIMRVIEEPSRGCVLKARLRFDICGIISEQALTTYWLLHFR